MISLYNLFMLPLEKLGIQKRRKYLLKHLHGRVLEIGAGTGANLAFVSYDRVDSYILTDKKKSKHLNVMEPLLFQQAQVEDLPFEDNTFDVVVHTLVFCSVTDVNEGLQEIQRVLKPGGTVLFIEHVIPHKKVTQGFFRFVNPVWMRLSGGCSLVRDYRQSLLDHSFCIIEEGYFFRSVFYYGKAQLCMKS